MSSASFADSARRPGVGLTELRLTPPLDRRGRLAMRAELAGVRAILN